MAQPVAQLKTIQYRRALFKGDVSQTLQQLLNAALSNKNQWDQRLQAADAAASSYRFINVHKRSLGLTFGQLISYEEGKYQLVLTKEKGKEYVPLSIMAPPVATDGFARDFAESILYFAALGNHVALVQGVGLRAKSLEDHLAWLLRDATNLIDAKHGFVLADSIPKATAAQIRKHHVRRIKIGRSFFEDGAAEDTTDTVPRGGRVRMQPKGLGIDVLKSFLQPQEIARLGLDRALDANLQVWIEVKFNRTTTDEGQEILDALGISFRNLDEDEVTLKLGDGSVVRGKDIRLASRISVITSSGVIDENDLIKKMRDYLREQIDSGAVEP